MSVPRFSVVVPTYNRPAQLGECLAALTRLKSPDGGFEICIVNDGGPTPPPEMVEAARRSGRPCAVTVIEQANAGPATARNVGAIAAKGECLAFTDDDCQPAADWLCALDRALRVSSNALVGGRTINALTDNLCSTTSQLLVDFVTSYFDGGTRGLFFASSNVAVSRAEFINAGGFDTRFAMCAAEDREFADRWWAQGRPFVEARSALVYHAHVLTLAGLGRQHFTYGRGAIAFRRFRRERGGRQPVDPRFYLESLRYPFQREPWRRAAAIAVLTSLAHAAYAAGLLSERVRAVEPP